MSRSCDKPSLEDLETRMSRPVHKCRLRPPPAPGLSPLGPISSPGTGLSTEACHHSLSSMHLSSSDSSPHQSCVDSASGGTPLAASLALPHTYMSRCQCSSGFSPSTGAPHISSVDDMTPVHHGSGAPVPDTRQSGVSPHPD